MKNLLSILLVLALTGCGTEPTIDYCEKATLLEYITYNGATNRAYFKTDDRSYYIHLDPETGLLLREGEVYTLCFDSNNNFKSIK